MVAVIKTGHSINRIVNYNENKVNEGVAQCIAAANYPVDVEQLTFKLKLNRLLKQASLNENVTRKSVQCIRSHYTTISPCTNNLNNIEQLGSIIPKNLM